jgi:hypothetical protein
VRDHDRSVSLLLQDGRVVVHPIEDRMQPFDAPAVGNAVQSRAQRRVPPRARKQPARQRAVIEARAAHDDREPAARVDVAQGGCGVFRILRRRALQWIDDVDEMMRNATAIADGSLSVPMSKRR